MEQTLKLDDNKASLTSGENKAKIEVEEEILLN